MALPSTGPLSLNQIHIEAGGSSGTLCSLNDADIRGIINKSVNTSNAISEYRGQSSEFVLTSGGTVNGQAQRQEITVSSFISSGGTLRIPSTMWVWSDSTSTAALTIDIPCTIINDGKIIGKGGQGGHGNTVISNSSSNAKGNGGDGGIAIKINSSVSGVTITNSSGAYIAGGGGGGGSSGVEPQNSYAGGGGGAGGGNGGSGGGVGTGNVGGTGGVLNATGGQHIGNPISSAPGGQAGGFGVSSSGEDKRSAGGGGGGRFLPGSSSTSNSAYVQGGNGGSAGSNGGSGGNSGKSGGGGGWGAAGGNGYRAAFGTNDCQGGGGGKAVEDSANSYTLNNSGTIYGATT